MTQNLDLAPIGNCAISALIDRQGRYVWACAPRVDGDPVFCNLLAGEADPAIGFFDVQVEGLESVEQDYLRNTPILRTVLRDAQGAEVEILDFAPRYRHSGRIYRPTAFIRLIRPLKGTPRLRIRMRPASDYGAHVPDRTFGSNHIRYVTRPAPFRLTTNVPVSNILEERSFRLEEDLALFMGPDEPFIGNVRNACAVMFQETADYWREWVRTLALPLEWQKVVIRSAITLKLCAYEETGAIVAALTTSIPEHSDSGRNWDYRYCWLRDAYYVVRALNRLGAADILENYLGYLRNIVDEAEGGHVQPVYGVGMEPALKERIVDSLPGYRGMGPVRVGNQAHEHLQHDVYGQIVLSNVQAFFDERLLRPATVEDFHALEKIGERAFALHDQPDAGLWEFRTIARTHTYSALLCWAACDRLSNAAEALGLSARVDYWRGKAQIIRDRIETEAWCPEEGRYAASFGGHELDASLLQLVDLRFLPADDPRFLATLEAVERGLRRGSHLLRYSDPDDFGEPKTAFNFCTFWFIEALHLTGRTEEARSLFEEMLGNLTHAGLLSEDIAFADGELWGNYPQTYSLVGLINCAIMLSRPWISVR
ncbi:glycoside hydrolase family 15 protein [Paracoccus sp. Z118]|uniref:glycoside hydrolase family 15 protein n=1 Tax=Paracoccus sp. Z118 TaxID=2851017 RepID=UPI001C2CC0A1|nr:glycoside hydrolase family 15 protein [Paracoccus sp. Z118]